MRRIFFMAITFLLIITSCKNSDPDVIIPTVANIQQLPTDQYLTANAPPPDYQLVSFDPLDKNLEDYQGWTYLLTGHFEGIYDDTQEDAEGKFEVQVWSNELGAARRVVLEVKGGALSPDETARSLEGVRISNDYYLVDTNGQCSRGVEQASLVADLSAGQLVGGVTNAIPTGQRGDVEGIPAWQYTFSPDNMRLPTVISQSDSLVDMSADLWIAPEYHAVLRFDLVLEVEHVAILWSKRPVTGTLVFHYELNVAEIGVVPNISIPNGC